MAEHAGGGGAQQQNLGAMAANMQHVSQGHSPQGAALASAMEVGLGEHPIKPPEAIPTFGTPIQLPGGMEGHGALSDTAISLGNQEIMGLPKDAVPGLHQVSGMGDTSLDKATSAKANLNIGEAGLDASNSLSSGGAAHG